MKTGIVHCSNGVTLLGAGHLLGVDVHETLTIAPHLVAADGGAATALDLGLMPEAVIGDLDSLSGPARAAIPPGRLIPVAEQETTDFEKCLTRIEAPFILGLGFAGPRIDHALAVWNALARHPARRCLILGAADLVFAAPERVDLALAPGTRVSLFPMAPATGRSEGLAWPIEGLALAPDGRIGTSNLAEGPVRLEFDGPGMLVILPRACLSAAIAALEPGFP